jgi:hypothetical protein
VETAIQRGRFHRARRAAHAAAGGTIRLCQDERNAVSRVVQPDERALSECRCSGEN